MCTFINEQLESVALTIDSVNAIKQKAEEIWTKA